MSSPSSLSCNHCPATFPETQEGVILLGQSDEQKKMAQFQAIDQHQQLMHPEVHVTGAVLIGKMAWLVVMSHVSENSKGNGIVQQGEVWNKRRQIAAEISHACGREVTDEDLETALQRIKPFLIHSHDRTEYQCFNQLQVLQMLKWLRDQMSYRDILKPAAPALAELNT